MSHHQGEIQWAEVPTSHFVFVKATEGVDYLDPQFRENWQGAGQRGLLRGAYHMFRPEDEVAPQVDWFVQQLRAVGFEAGRDLPPALDIEGNSGVSRVSKSTLRGRAEAFLDSLQREFGVRPFVYTNPTFWAEVLEPEHQLTNFPLWLAAYTSELEPPQTVEGWSRWTFWQHADDGRVAGVPRPTDLNRFHGSGAQLRQLLAQ